MNSSNQSCLDNHRSFRVLLQAMSRPGKIFQLPGGIESRQQAVLQTLECLLDPQVSCCLLDADPELEKQLLARTGVRQANVATADFLLAPQGKSNGQLLQAKRGRLDYPDEGATILFAVESLVEGKAGSGLPLRGPGVKDCIYPRIAGLDPADVAALKLVNNDYPLGVDSIFIDRRGQLLCIPRSTRIGGD